MKTINVLVALLCCSLISGCATPLSAYMQPQDWQQMTVPQKQTLSVNQLLANAQGRKSPLQYSLRLAAKTPMQQPRVFVVFKLQSTTLSIADQNRLQLFSKSVQQQRLSIECGAAGKTAFDNFRIALHRCQNIQRFLKLISQDARAQVIAAQPLKHTSVSILSVNRGAL